MTPSRMPRTRAWLLALAVAALAGCTSTPQTAAQWTLMVFMEADNNLELDALLDLFEMEMVGSTDEVHVVVQIDRAEGYTQADGGWTDTRRYRVESNGQHEDVGDLLRQREEDPASLQLASTALENIGEIDGGDPASLTDFIRWAVDGYPAERYGLIMLSHGGTWVGGFGADGSHDKSALSLPELDQALTDAREQTGAEFEFIGFDACLMAQLEVFEVLSRHARYAAAAQELEPAYGWYYTPLLERLTADPGMGGDELATIAVETFMQFYDEVWPELTGRSFNSEYDLSAVDLQRMPEVMTVLDRFAEVAEAESEALLGPIAAARTYSQSFGGNSPDAVDWLSSIDLRDFLDALLLLIDDEVASTELVEAALALDDALDDLVLLSQQTEGLSGANGAAVFFPRSPRTAAIEGNFDRYAEEVTAFASWRGFLDGFYVAAERSAGPLEVEIDDIFQLDPVLSIHEPISIAWTSRGLNIVREQFAATLLLEDGTGLMLEQADLASSAVDADGESLFPMHPGEDSAYFTWNVDMPALTDGDAIVPTLLLPTDDDSRFAISGEYRFAAGSEMDATLIVEDSEVVQVWGVSESALGAQPHEINPTAGDTFTPTWRSLDEEGETVLRSSGVELTFSDQPFTVTDLPALSGEYELTIRVEDVSGRSVVQTVLVKVDNEGREPEWRLDTTLEDGISLPYPWDATFSTVFLEDGAIEEYLDLAAGFEVRMLSSLFVDTVVEGPDDLPALVTTYLALLDEFDVAELDAPAILAPDAGAPLEVAGQSGFQVPYTAYDGFYEADVRGLLLALWAADIGVGYVIDVRDVDGDPTDYLEVLDAYLALFEPLL